MLLRVLLVFGVTIGVLWGNSAARAQSEVVPAPTPTVDVTRTQSTVYHSGWGALQSDGTLNGKVLTVGTAGTVQSEANAEVTLSQDLVVLATTQADAEGNFSFSGLSPGVYEIAAETPNSYAINSFQAIAGNESSSAAVMNVYAARMVRANVDDVLKSLWAPQEMVGSTRQFEQLIAPLMPATQSQRVAIRGGSVSGQVAFANSVVIPESHVIKVFRNGTLLATAPVDAMGRFSFPVQAAGPVDLVLGGSAYATMGVELVDDTRVTALSTGDTRFVSAAVEALAVADSLVVPAVGGPVPGDAVPPPPPLAMAPPMPMGGGFAPMGGGGFGGGAGGGGLGGGLGGLGGLLGIGGLALGAVALADNDDGFTTPVGTQVITVQ